MATTAKVEWLHDANEWEALKPVIRRLYLDESLPLKQVMQQMRQLHKFHATSDMFKERLARWGFRKNLKSKEALAIIKSTRSRAATQGKWTCATIGNLAVDSERLDKHIKRKYQTLDKLMVAINSNAATTAAGLRCTTPPPELFLSNGAFDYHHILIWIREYFSSSFENNIWVNDLPWTDCSSTRENGGDMVQLKDFYSQNDLACALLDDGQVAEAGLALQTASMKIGNILQAEHPRMLTAFFDLGLSLARRRRSEIASIMFKQATALSSINLRETHPVTNIFAKLLGQRPADFEPALMLVWRCAVERFEEILGRLHYTSLRCRLEYIQMAIGLDNPQLAFDQIGQLVERCAQECGLDDVRTLKLLETHADVAWDLGLIHDCNIIANKLFIAATCLQQSDNDKYVELTCSGMFNIARCQFAAGSVAEAVTTLSSTISLYSTSRRARHALTTKYLLCRQQWTRNIGATYDGGGNIE